MAGTHPGVVAAVRAGPSPEGASPSCGAPSSLPPELGFSRTHQPKNADRLASTGRRTAQLGRKPAASRTTERRQNGDPVTKAETPIPVRAWILTMQGEESEVDAEGTGGVRKSGCRARFLHFACVGPRHSLVPFLRSAQLPIDRGIP